MIKKPLISVVMPSYNSAPFLSEAIESVLSQTFKNFEFIIIDDCSTDNSWKIIQKYAEKDKRIITLKNNKNLKICKTLNKGIKIARGKYIARFDSDDICLPKRFEKQVKFMEKNNKVGVVGTNFYLINKNGKYIGQKNFPKTNQECKKAFLFYNPFGHNTVLIRKKCFDEFGGYDNKFVYAEDLELWMRFGQKYNFYNIQKNLLKYRLFNENSILKNQKTMIKNALKARKKAIINYNYPIGPKGYIAYFTTWCMLFLPPRLVFILFKFLRKYV